METEEMAEHTAIEKAHMRVHIALEEVVFIESIYLRPIYLLDETTRH